MEALLADIAAWLSTYEVFLRWLSWAVIVVGLSQNLVYASHIPIAWRELRQHSQAQDTQTAWDFLTSKASLPISVIVPAFNEENTIIESVRSLLALRYPKFELIIVNDGSNDKTLQTLIEKFYLKPVLRARDRLSLYHEPIRGIYASQIHPELLVVDKQNGGSKADAANAGLACVRTPLFCVIDADSILEPDSLLIAVRPFMESSENVIAVGGTVNIVNGCEIRNGQVVKFDLPKRFLPRVQVVEYTRAFLMARLASSRVGTLALISGAFGIFRRDIVVEAGGFDKSTLGEDMELVLKLHKHMKDKGEEYSIRYVPEPVCWTEAPETLSILGSQRVRWQRGAIGCIAKYRSMIFNPKYGRLGLVTIPLMVLVDIVAPLVELLGYFLIPFLALIGVLSVKFFIAYMALIFLFGIFLSTMSVLLEQAELERLTTPDQLLRLTLASICEHFGYRQLCNYWRIKGVFHHFTGKKHSWGSMPRVGFRTARP